MPVRPLKGINMCPQCHKLNAIVSIDSLNMRKKDHPLRIKEFCTNCGFRRDLGGRHQMCKRFIGKTARTIIKYLPDLQRSFFKRWGIGTIDPGILSDTLNGHITVIYEDRTHFRIGMKPYRAWNYPVGKIYVKPMRQIVYSDLADGHIMIADTYTPDKLFLTDDIRKFIAIRYNSLEAFGKPASVILITDAPIPKFQLLQDPKEVIVVAYDKEIIRKHLTILPKDVIIYNKYCDTPPLMNSEILKGVVRCGISKKEFKKCLI